MAASLSQGPDLEIDAATETILPTLEVAAVAFVAFASLALLGRLVLVPAVVRVVARRNPDNPTVVEGVQRFTVLLLGLVALGVAIVAAGFGHVLSGSALVIAAATLALGVAGQAVIGNLVSGLFLVADPEFNVRDWIRWADGEGVVETIHFRVTRVRTADEEVITVPNTTLATTAISRPYSRDRYRIAVRLGIAHDEDPSTAEAILLDAVGAVDGALGEPAPRVVVDDLGEDALWLRVLFWVGDPTRIDVVEARSAYVRGLHERLEDADVVYSQPSDHVVTGAIDVDRGVTGDTSGTGDTGDHSDEP